jgi:LysM repeat protein
MTDRGLPSVDGSPACPFVAFEDDRDERSTSPDHRHRCFAEDGPPAPRAAAHQEAYCLSSAFPVCPTFQAWARREAARAKTTEPSERERDQRAMAGMTGADEWTRPPTSSEPVEAVESTPRRNPPRDWAAPPPWAPGGAAGGAAAGAAASGGGAATAGSGVAGGAVAAGAAAGAAAAAAGGAVDPPGFVGRQPPAGQGLAGSAADRLAGGEAPPRPPAERTAAAPMPPSEPRAGRGDPADGPIDPDLAALVAGASVASRSASSERQPIEDDLLVEPAAPARRQPVSSTRSDRDRGSATKLPPREHVQGPSWERARRNEAYPTIKTRAGLGSVPGVPRALVLFAALIIAAIALFFLPGFFGVGGPDDADPSSSPRASQAAPTATPEPTPVPDPTPQTYTIKEGDTLSGIARSFGLSLDELLAANEETIEDPNLIAVGDVIIIPAAAPEEVPGGASEEPTE